MVLKVSCRLTQAMGDEPAKHKERWTGRVPPLEHTHARCLLRARAAVQSE